jgi:dTDP-4-amino-4,6-dideoxygalactose transaminase
MKIPIARPQLGPEETAAVAAVLASGELAQGRWVKDFEDAFAAYCGARYAVATSSGTTALHLALLAHGIGPGDDVVTTPFTFVASSNAILYVGARPVFADIEPDTFNIDPQLVERAITPRTRAVLAVDLFGHPADLAGLRALCERRGLVLIEDACQAHGAEVDGSRVGSQGTACFSFYPTKNMTTGEGGMLTTDDAAVAEAARLRRQHGSRQQYVHEELGFNFRMTNVQAAMGLVQLERLEGFNQNRIANAEYLTQNIRAPQLTPPVVRPGARHVFHQYTVRVKGGDRDRLRDRLAEHGVESRVYYPVPVHRQPLYADLQLGEGQFPEAELAAAEVLSLPVHPGLSSEELETVATAVEQSVRQLNQALRS